LRTGIGRQIERDPGAGAKLAVEMDAAAGLCDETVDLAQAQAAAFAGLLGRVERLEGARHRVRRHSRAGVADRDGDVFAEWQTVDCRRRLLDALDRGLDRDGA